MPFERFRRRDATTLQGGPAARAREAERARREVDKATGARLKEAERSLRDAERSHDGRIRETRKEIERLERDRQKRLRDARVEIKRREAEHARRVEEADRRLASVRATLAPLEVARWGKLKLFEDRIVTRDGEVRLGRGVTALVDTAARIAIARPAAVARLAAGGRVDGRAFRSVQGLDARKVFMLIEAPEFVSLVPIRWGEEDAAFDFTERVNIAALNARRIERQREDAVGEAERELQLVAAFRPEIEVLEAEVQRLEDVLPELEQANARLSELEGDTAEIDGLRSQLERVRLETEAARAAAAQAAREAAEAAEAAARAEEEARALEAARQAAEEARAQAETAGSGGGDRPEASPPGEESAAGPDTGASAPERAG